MALHFIQKKSANSQTLKLTVPVCFPFSTLPQGSILQSLYHFYPLLLWHALTFFNFFLLLFLLSLPCIIIVFHSPTSLTKIQMINQGSNQISLSVTHILLPTICIPVTSACIYIMLWLTVSPDWEALMGRDRDLLIFWDLIASNPLYCSLQNVNSYLFY